MALYPMSVCVQVSVRGLPLLLVVGGLGILLGLGNTDLPWGQAQLFLPLLHVSILSFCPFLLHFCISDVGYSLVDKFRGYTLDRENNCIAEQVGGRCVWKN